MQFLIAQWLHWLQLFFSRKAVADRLQYMCDRGFKLSTSPEALLVENNMKIDRGVAHWEWKTLVKKGPEDQPRKARQVHLHQMPLQPYSKQASTLST